MRVVLVNPRVVLRKGVIAVYERDVDEESAVLLDDVYIRLRNAAWIREVDAGRVKVVVFPTVP